MGKALSTDVVFWEVSGQKKLRWQRLNRTLGQAMRQSTVLAPGADDLSERLAIWTAGEAEVSSEPSNVVQLATHRFSEREVAENEPEQTAPTVTWQPSSPSDEVPKSETYVVGAPVEASPRLVVSVIVALFVALIAISFAGATYRHSTQWQSRAKKSLIAVEASQKSNAQLSSKLKTDSSKITELQGQRGCTKETTGLAIHVTNLAKTAATSAASCNQKTQAALTELQKHGSSASAVKRMTSDANKSCAVAQDDYNVLQNEVNSLQH